MTTESALDDAVGFVHALRSAGVEIPTGSTMTYVDSLALLDLSVDRSGYWAGRSTLLRRPEDVEIYDAIYTRYWSRRTDDSIEAEPEVVTFSVDDPDADLPEAQPGPDAGPQLTVRYSARDVLTDKDFADYTDDEMREAQRLMSQMRFVGALRQSRRPRASNRRRGRPDLRRTVRTALRSSGEPVRREFVEPGTRPRRIVLILDVSGSMEPYARAFLRFVHAAVVARGRIEAFALGTRLTRMTRELSTHDPDRALRRAAESVVDFSGGTRLGECMQTFNQDWGVRGMARGAIVVVLSDGWDRGDPAVLGAELERLHRVTHRLVWVNPLKATPGYAPLAKGMAAALPHLDEFIEGHSIRALDDLAAVISDSP